MSAYKYSEKIDKTQRYKFGELISENSNFLLFLTATPHRGDPENFRLLLDLLEPGFFADTSMLSESIQDKDNPLFLRRLKEDLKNFDGTPIFPPRHVHTIKYYLSDKEKELYNAVTEYVEKHFNKALKKEKRNVTFALTILQRRLASSARAIRKSLERRYERLKELYEKGQFLQEEGYDEDFIEDLEEKERWKKEEELLEKLTSSETLEELKSEIEKLDELLALAKEVEKKEIETKLNELKKLMDEEKLHHSGTKLLIFTESKDTLDYLVEKLRKWGYLVTSIHGGMNLDARIHAEADFRNKAQIMVSTEAGGEGINLQFCWFMVNYDIPWNPNRLEQRMGRIHRYGQQHEVHIYNVVAVDTREGQILNRLFDKLSQIRDHLGSSDRVFDVIGEVLVGKSLKDLLVDAIANLRTMEDILKDFERVPDEEAIRRIMETSMEALATRHIDLSRILKEQRKAKENRLVPEYIEEFFKKAAHKLNIKMEKRENDLWHISSVPFEIRIQSNDFKINFGEVQKEYARISFDKEKAFKTQSEFVAMGHPLLEAVINNIINQFSQSALDGALFIDPEGKRNGVIWFLDTEIKDGNNSVAGKKLFAVYQNINSLEQPENFVLLNPAVLWDLKPLSAKKSSSQEKPKQFEHSNLTTEDSVKTETSSDYELGADSLDKDAVISFIINNGVESYKKELFERRQRDAKIKEKYGIRSLESMISKSDEKISDYETRRIKGENIPDVTIQNEVRKKEDSCSKKERLKKEIVAESHLFLTDPKILCLVRVIPDEITAKMVSDKEIEKIGMKYALNYELRNGRTPEDVSSQNLGFDIRSNDVSGNYRYIEVKARAKEGDIVLTPNEWFKAQRLKEEYWLYIVINAASNPELYCIQNPAAKFKPEQEIDIVRYVVKNWKEKAEASND